MKCIRVAPGKFLTISDDLADKAERVFGRGLTRELIEGLKAPELRQDALLMAGSPKPLAPTKSWALSRPAIGGVARRKISASTAPRRRSR